MLDKNSTIYEQGIIDAKTGYDKRDNYSGVELEEYLEGWTKGREEIINPIADVNTNEAAQDNKALKKYEPYPYEGGNVDDEGNVVPMIGNLGMKDAEEAKDLYVTIIDAGNPDYGKEVKVLDYQDGIFTYEKEDGTTGTEKFEGTTLEGVNPDSIKPLLGFNTFTDNSSKDKNNISLLPTTFFIPKAFTVSLMNTPLAVVPDINLGDRFLATTIPGTYQIIKIENDIIYYDNIDKVKPVIIAGTKESYDEAINKGWILPRGTWGNLQQ